MESPHASRTPAGARRVRIMGTPHEPVVSPPATISRPSRTRRPSRRLGMFGAVGDAKPMIPFAKLPDWFGKVERVKMPPISRVIRRSGRSVLSTCTTPNTPGLRPARPSRTPFCGDPERRCSCLDGNGWTSIVISIRMNLPRNASAPASTAKDNLNAKKNFGQKRHPPWSACRPPGHWYYNLP